MTRSTARIHSAYHHSVFRILGILDAIRVGMMKKDGKRSYVRAIFPAISGGSSLFAIDGNPPNPDPKVEPPPPPDYRAEGLEAARKALERKSCRDYIKGEFGEDPLALLNKLAAKGEFKLGNPDDPTFGLKGHTLVHGYTRCTGENATIVLDPGVNRPNGEYRSGFYDVLGGSTARKLKLSTAQGIALGFLHELSHATGRYVHAGDPKFSDKTEVKTQDEEQVGIYENCFK